MIFSGALACVADGVFMWRGVRGGLQEMVSKLADKMTSSSLTDLINHTTVFRNEKRDAEQRIASAKANASNVQANQRANKKKSAQKQKARSILAV